MRLFIAVTFPENIKEALEKDAALLREELVSGRFVKRNAYHLTLEFLGEVPYQRVKDVQEAMDQCEFQKFPITIGDLGRFRRQEGDILWREVKAPKTLYELQKKLSDGLRMRGFSLETRPFRPHMTIARNAVLKNEDAWDILRKRKDALSFSAESITLMRSVLSEKGPIYTPVYVLRASK